MKLKDELSERQNSVLAFIEVNKTVSAVQIREHIQQSIGDITKMTVSSDLERLLELHFIEKQGAGRAVTYQLLSRYSIIKKIDVEKYFSWMLTSEKYMKNSILMSLVR